MYRYVVFSSHLAFKIQQKQQKICKDKFKNPTFKHIKNCTLNISNKTISREKNTHNKLLQHTHALQTILTKSACYPSFLLLLLFFYILRSKRFVSLANVFTEICNRKYMHFIFSLKIND